MSDLETRFHETWLGLVQPTEGLVVSVPVLSDASCMKRLGPEVQETLEEVSVADFIGEGHEREPSRRIVDLSRFFADVLGHPAAHFDAGDRVPSELSLYVPEGKQTLRPTRALLADPRTRQGREVSADAGAAVKAGAPYLALVWEVDAVLRLDKPETTTGPWEYPLAAKFDRLLRHCQVPIGILTNGRVIRLVYAPHGESSGHIDFRVDHMAAIDGRPILDALVMLLGEFRFYAAGTGRTLPELLAASRKRQADVTNDLARQVFDAIQILLRGFELAADRDGSSLLREAVAREDDHVYGGLLTVLLRLVFILYAEDWALLPVESRVWAQHYSVLGLFEQLQTDHGSHPDSMSRRFGAWGRLVALFRAIYLGVEHTADKDGKPDPRESLSMPPRRGHLFDPGRFPFLEGWPDAGAPPIKDPDARAAVRVPSIDDATVFAVLEKLILYRPKGADHGQRLSYRALDVEQLGSVYEGLMGYHVETLGSVAVALEVSSKRSAARAWVEIEELMKHEPARRASWLEKDLGFDKATARSVAAAVEDAKDATDALDALVDEAAGKAKETARSKDKRARAVAEAGRLVLQPGPERRRTSSHYTPRELSAPIVRRTLEPLLAVMGEAPASERILNLKICDPAMGSGAFLVEACRFLADEVVKAWTREGPVPPPDYRQPSVPEEPTLVARRLVAQRCLYGVDKNAYAVDLAKLSLWLVTLAKAHPFTFLDHALRHGDSLVGLDFEQIGAGHWKVEGGLKKSSQTELAAVTLREALAEAITIRQEIVDLAKDPTPAGQRLKEQKLSDADDALSHARLLADLVVGAFFAHEKDKDREKERARRVDAFATWKMSGEATPPAQLLEWQRELREGVEGERSHAVPAFHWMLEFPEVFYAERPDPLDENQVNRAAYMDAFVGNPPFAGKNRITEANGEGYIEWLQALHPGSHGAADLSAHFFLRAGSLLGAHGTLGLIATNTIAQGDTRESGLKPMVASGDVIYDATPSMEWPGEAGVVVSVVHVAMGRPSIGLERRLDGERVPALNSRLIGAPERPDPIALSANADLSFKGAVIYGNGFTLSPEEREVLVARNPRNAERIYPYIGGQEGNTSPTQSHDRYVINFGRMSLEQAQEWPDLIGIVREKVKPERDRLRQDTGTGRHGRKYWWQFVDRCDPLNEALSGSTACLVTSQVSKHLVFGRQPVDRVLANTLYVFPLRTLTAFAVLQSRAHAAWTFLLASSMGRDNQLRYAATDCFETFPFPAPDPRTLIPALEDLGRRLYDARAKYMLDEQVGLTITYNRLKDRAETDPRIVDLRRLHEAMDAAVLSAYDWQDIAVPPFCIASPADQAALDKFENEVIDRLFALNARRAEEERVLGVGAGPATKLLTKNDATATKPTAKRAKKKPDDGAQGSLL